MRVRWSRGLERNWRDSGEIREFAVRARFGAFEVDLGRRLLLHAGADVRLTPKAFELLALLVDAAPRVLQKQELHKRLWKGQFVSDASLAGLVKELRHALNDHDRNARIIRTAHGVGYCFEAPLERAGLAHSAAVIRWVVVGSRRIVLDEGENVIGRDSASAIYLNVGGVSRRHARILLADNDARLEDLSSKNGTMLNQVPVSAPMRLHDGDCIQVGPAIVLYHASVSGVSTDTLAGRRR